MPSLKTFFNTLLVLFILFSIPVTVLIAQRAGTVSRAASYPFSLSIKPDNQTIIQGGSYPYTLEFNFSPQYRKNPVPIYLEFAGIPEGVTLLPQPLGATGSNNFQRIHKYSLITTPQVPLGSYTITVTASDLSRVVKSSFSFNLKK